MPAIEGIATMSRGRYSAGSAKRQVTSSPIGEVTAKAGVSIST
jgi:hypothetical protein